MIGEPFVGPSGQLLDEFLERCQVRSWAICNVVCCYPRAEEGFREPTGREAGNCLPHLVEFVRLVQPRLIVTLGVTATKYVRVVEELIEGPARVELHHPSFILRSGGRDTVYYDQFVSRLSNALKEM